MRSSTELVRFAAVVLFAAAVGLSAGCNPISRVDLGTDLRGSQHGRVYYVGGAGTFGNVGMIDVPKGLRRAGWRGSVEVFKWQSTLGGTVRDQIDHERNREKARELAREIVSYARRYPGRPVHIVALSAGTGIATWALESLPDGVDVENVVFLASSLSRSYNLTSALRRVKRRVYNFYSPDDPVLRYALPITGSVDREHELLGSPAVAGLLGFELRDVSSERARMLYDARVQNMPYRKKYREYGYRGNHTDVTSADFIEHVVAPLIIKQRHVATSVPPADGGGSR
ncbi:MAG: hypothetical protein GX547_06485 [Phycisphaerae bacterium]|nr:hypothetical protein [Phycisphaerae bacterium]